jgi:hypothetical protein
VTAESLQSVAGCVVSGVSAFARSVLPRSMRCHVDAPIK